MVVHIWILVYWTSWAWRNLLIVQTCLGYMLYQLQINQGWESTSKNTWTWQWQVKFDVKTNISELRLQWRHPGVHLWEDICVIMLIQWWIEKGSMFTVSRATFNPSFFKINLENIFNVNITCFVNIQPLEWIWKWVSMHWGVPSCIKRQKFKQKVSKVDIGQFGHRLVIMSDKFSTWGNRNLCNDAYGLCTKEKIYNKTYARINKNVYLSLRPFWDTI